MFFYRETRKRWFLFVLFTALLIVGASIYFFETTNKVSQEPVKIVTREKYSFAVPRSWIVADPFNADGCIWDSVANDTSDGHRMAGEIGIYPMMCYNPDISLGKRDITQKDGYYIISYYDIQTGTTEEEIEETKNVYKELVRSFKILP